MRWCVPERLAKPSAVTSERVRWYTADATDRGLLQNIVLYFLSKNPFSSAVMC